jgi:hypothetical protein
MSEHQKDPAKSSCKPEGMELGDREVGTGSMKNAFNVPFTSVLPSMFLPINIYSAWTQCQDLSAPVNQT